MSTRAKSITMQRSADTMINNSTAAQTALDRITRITPIICVHANSWSGDAQGADLPVLLGSANALEIAVTKPAGGRASPSPCADRRGGGQGAGSPKSHVTPAAPPPAPRPPPRREATRDHRPSHHWADPGTGASHRSPHGAPARARH